MGRAPCCDKANVKKGPWSPEEDAKLKSYIDQHGTGGNWIALPQKIGLKRCGKSCRLRWLNYLRPNIKHGGFSEEEDNIICSLYVSIGSRWSIIAAQLPGRTDNDIKNYWNTRLKKKLLGKQRKEQQQAQQARRVSNLKHQEVKRETENFMVAAAYGSVNMSTQADPYWPATEYSVPPVPMTVVANNAFIQDYHDLNKQGGIRFSGPEDHQQPYSTTINSQDSCDIPTTNMIIDPLANSGGTCGHQPSNTFTGFENFTNDLISELVCVNPQQIQMEGFYGMEYSMDMSNNGSTSTITTTSTESTSTWGDNNMSSLVNYSPNLVSDHYEAGCRQGIPQDAAFEDSRYFGMQLQ